MAAIDKLYASSWDYKEFKAWCLIHKPSLLKNMYEPFYPVWDNPRRERPIANFSHKQDRYLYWHCPLDFVKLFWRK